jgi:hypothetical protein
MFFISLHSPFECLENTFTPALNIAVQTAAMLINVLGEKMLLIPDARCSGMGWNGASFSVFCKRPAQRKEWMAFDPGPGLGLRA